MKNKIITLLCILVILITTAIVSFADRQAYDISPTSADRVSVDQNIWKYNDNGLLVAIDNNDVIYPVVGEENALDRITTVTNRTKIDYDQDISVFVRTVFAFEAGNLEIDDFHKTLYVVLNQEMTSDGAYWIYPNNEDWVPIQKNGKKYYVMVATYSAPLGCEEYYNETIPSLLKVGFESGATSDMVKEFGDKYKLMVETQAVATTGFDPAATTAEAALDAAFGVITKDNHPF